MKMERLSQDKIRIFLTFDDLVDRGIQKDDMWREIPKVHELFSEMMEQAYSELGFDATGPLAVEVFALPAQGMVVIVTRGRTNRPSTQDDDDEDEEQDVYELEVTLEESDSIMYAFSDFEYALAAAKKLKRITSEGALYAYKGRYMLRFDHEELDEPKQQALTAVLSEYGDASSVTLAVLEEYGKTIIKEGAVGTLCQHFS